MSEDDYAAERAVWKHEQIQREARVTEVARDNMEIAHLREQVEAVPILHTTIANLRKDVAVSRRDLEDAEADNVTLREQVEALTRYNATAEMMRQQADSFNDGLMDALRAAGYNGSEAVPEGTTYGVMIVRRMAEQVEALRALATRGLGCHLSSCSMPIIGGTMEQCDCGLAMEQAHARACGAIK